MTKWKVSVPVTLAIAILVLVLLMSSAFSQTTGSSSSSVYPVTGGGGTATTPTRISFTANGASMFLESGYNTSCGGQTTQPLGFLLLNGTCAPVTTQPVGSCGTLYAEFYGTDATTGVPFNGTLTLTTECHYVRLRYSKTVYTVTGGTLTITTTTQ